MKLAGHGMVSIGKCSNYLQACLDASENVRLYCRECHRDRIVPLASLVTEQDVAQDIEFRDLARRIRCTRCDRKRVQIMAQSHTLGAPLDYRALRLATNVNRVPCPECGSTEVSRSAPLRRPLNESRFKPWTMMYEYDCENCRNWWTADEKPQV